MKPKNISRSSRILTRGAPLTVLLVVASVVTSSCGSDPFAYKWTASKDTVLLYSLARPEFNLYSGFNFYQRTRVRIEAATSTGTWDMAVDTRNGQIVLLPPGALGVTSKARITVVSGKTFDEVTDAPADTMVYTANDPVPVSKGNIYVVRTGQSIGAYGTPCVYYAKLEPVDIDATDGTLSFAFDSSPVCNDRRLIPPN
jgi:hypothetical protein